MSFIAQFRTPCANGDTIMPGEEIEAVPGAGYQHVECAEVPDPAAPAAHEVSCPDCFMIHPKGACD